MESFSLLINSSCTKHIKPLLATASKPITRSCNNCVRVMIRLLYTMSDFLNQKGPWLSGPIPVFNNQGDWGPWPWTNDSSWGGDEKPGHSAEWGIPWFSNAASHPNTIFAQSSQCGGCMGPLQSMDAFQLMFICRDSSVSLKRDSSLQGNGIFRENTLSGGHFSTIFLKHLFFSCEPATSFCQMLPS